MLNDNNLIMDNILNNIDQFNLTTLAVLENLYVHFPTPIEINPSNFGAGVTPNDATFESAFKYAANAPHVITWLAEEGFLRYGNQSKNGEFYQVRLSMKGIMALGSVPSSLTLSAAKEPLIAQVKSVLASGSKKLAAESGKVVITEVFKAATKFALAYAGVSIP
jgi:hypothetical protein